MVPTPNRIDPIIIGVLNSSGSSSKYHIQYHRFGNIKHSQLDHSQMNEEIVLPTGKNQPSGSEITE